MAFQSNNDTIRNSVYSKVLVKLLELFWFSFISSVNFFFIINVVFVDFEKRQNIDLCLRDYKYCKIGF